MSTESNRKSFWRQILDDKIGWTVCFASVVLNLIRNGMTFGFGVFIAQLNATYGTSMAELNWIGVLVICLSNLLSPITFFIIRKAPVKGYMICSLCGSLLQALACFSSSFVTLVPIMFFTFSFLFGLGSSLVLISSSLIINTFFPASHPHHVFATAMFQCAFPIATLIYSSLYGWLLKFNTLEFAFRVAGAKALVIGPICSLLFLLRRKPDEERKALTTDVDDGTAAEETEVEKYPQEDVTVDSKWLDIVRRPERIFWLLSMFLVFSTQLVPILNLPHYMEERGYDKLKSALPITILSFCETLGYIILAILGNKLKGRLVFVNIISCLGFSVVLMIWPSIDPSYTDIMILSSALGIFLSMSFIFMYAGSREAMDMTMDISWTATCFFSGVGSLLSPFISGAVYDSRKLYSDVFYVVGSVCIVNFAIFSGIPVAKYVRNKRKGYEDMK